MKNLAAVDMVQRTDSGNNESECTILYLIKGVHNNKTAELYTKQDAETLMKDLPWSVDVLGTVKVIHPAVMSGTTEENKSRMIKEAYTCLEEKGILNWPYIPSEAI